MRQTPRALVARRQFQTPTASRTPAASGRGAIPAPAPEPALRASGAGIVHPPPVSGKLRHDDWRDLESG